MVFLTIGRNQNNDWIIQSDKVSGLHARAYFNDGNDIILEDLDSMNGTLVDGRKVKQAVVDSHSYISLGSEVLAFGDLRSRLRHKNRDFTEEFEHLRSVYNTYRNDLEKIRRSDEKKNFVIRLAFSLIPLVVMLFFINSIAPELRIFFFMGAPVIFMVVSHFKQLNSKSRTKMEELSEKFLKEYKCPSCRCSLGNASWNVLADQRYCLSCKAIWVKDVPIEKHNDYG